MANRQINYNINYNVNKTSLNDLKKQLQEIQSLSAKDLVNMGSAKGLIEAEKQLRNIKDSATEIQAIFNRSYNFSLGTTDLTKLSTELKKIDISKLATNFNNAGAAGRSAFRTMTTEILTTNLQLKESNTWMKKLGETMSNTIRWTITSSVMNSFTSSIQKAYSYAKGLDTSLNNIRIVTEKSADQMDKFAISANRAAKNLAASTRDYTDAALIYYQQGLNDTDVAARAETTLKVANVTKQSTDTVSEQLTAVWNGYKVNAQEAELYIDKLSAVAATTASDLEELSTGMSKVASAANTMGVDIDQLNAQIATIISVTRQAPESVGTALKTIYARMGDIESGLDSETTLGEYTAKMAEMGINVLDMNGKLRDMGDVIEEIGNKWTELSREQQVALSQTMAGTRQYNNLLALFENWDMYSEAIETSRNSMGALQKQQDIYMESTEAHLQKLRTSMERIYDGIIDSDGLNAVIDIITALTDGMGNYIEAIGGASGAFMQFGGIITKVLGNQVARSLTTFIYNLDIIKKNMAQLNAQAEIMKDFKGINIEDENFQKLVQYKQQIIEFQDTLTDEQRQQGDALLRTRNELANQKEEWEENAIAAEEYYKKAVGEEAASLNLKDPNKFGTLAETEKKLDEAISGYTEKRKEFENNIIDIEKEYSAENLASIEEYFKNMTDVIDIGLIKNNKVKEELQKSIIDFGDIKYDESLEGYSEKQIQAIQRFKKAYLEAEKEIRESSAVTKKFTADAYQGAFDQITIGLKSADEQLEEFIKKEKVQAFIQSLTELTSEIFMIGSAWESVSNLGSIWDNENLTTGEKLLQTIFALSNGIMGLTQSYKLLKTLTNGLNLAFGTEGVLLAKNTKDQKKNTDEKEKNAEASKKQKKEISNANEAVIKNSEFVDKNTNVLEENTKAKQKNNKDGKKDSVQLNLFEDVLDPYKEEKKHLKEEMLKRDVDESYINNILTELDFENKEWIDDFKNALLGDKETNEKGTLAIERVKNTKAKNKIHKDQLNLGEEFSETLEEQNKRVFSDAVIEAFHIADNKEKERKNINIDTSNIKESTEAIEKTNEALDKTNEEGEKSKGVFSELGKALKKVPIQGWLIVGALAAAGTAAYILYKNWNKDAEAAEKARKNAEALAEEQTKVTQELNEMKGLWDTYKTAEEKLKSCTKGTQEWKEALLETNQAAIDLINNLSNMENIDVSSLYTRNADTGEITLNQDAIQDVINQKQNQANIASMAAAQGKYDAEIAQVKADLTKAIRQETSLGFKASDLSGELLKNISEYITLPFDEFKEKISSLGYDFSATNQDMHDLQEKINQLGISAENSSKKLDLITDIKIDEILGESYDGATKKAVSEKTRQEEARLTEELKKKYKGDGISIWSGVNNEIYQGILNDLNKAGYNLTAQRNNAVRGADTNRSFAFIDKNGKEVTYSAEAIAAMIAASKALKNVKENADNVVEAFQDLEKNVPKDIAKGINTFLSTGNFESMNQASFEQMQNDINSNYNGDVVKYLSDKTGKDINKLLADGTIEKFKEQMGQYTEVLNNFKNGFLQEVQWAYSQIEQKTKQLSLGTNKKIMQIMQDALIYGGKDSMNLVKDIFNKIPNDQIEKFGKVLENIDWNTTSTEDFITIIRQAGVDTSKFSEKEMKKFIDVMKIAQEIANDTSAAIRKQYADTKQVVNSLSNDNTSISLDQYNLLSENMKQYFVEMIDGTYKLIIAAEEFKSIWNQTKFNNINSSIQSLATINKDILLIQDKIKNLEDKRRWNWDSLKSNAKSMPKVTIKKDKDGNVETETEIRLDETILKKQLDFLNMINKYLDKDTQEKLQQWQKQLKEHDFNIDTEAILKKVKEGYQIITEEFKKELEKNSAEIRKFMDQKAYELSDNYFNLKSAYKEYNLDNNPEDPGIDADAFYKGYQMYRANHQYDGLDSEELDEYTKGIQEFAKESKIIPDSFETDERAAKKWAGTILKLNEAVETLTDNYKDWMDIINNDSINHLSAEYVSAVNNMKKAVGDLLGVSEDAISKDFIINYQTQIKKASTGNEKEIEKLREQYVNQLPDQLYNEIVELGIETKLNFTGNSEQEFKTVLQQLQDYANDESNWVNGVLKLDTTEYTNALNSLPFEAKDVQSQLQKYYEGMGMQAKWGVEEVDAVTYVPTYKTFVRTTPNNNFSTAENLDLEESGWQLQQESMVVPGPKQKITGKNAAFALGVSSTANGSKMLMPKIEGYTKSAPSSLGNYSTKNPGGGSPGSKKGGGSKPKKKEHLKNKPDRYHKVDTQLEKISNNISKLDAQTEHLSGQKLLDNLNEKMSLLNKNITTTREKLKIANEESNELKQKLSAQGVIFNADGTVSNYAEALNAKLAAHNALIDKYNSMSEDAKDNFEETLEKSEEDFNQFKEDIDRIDELTSNFIPELQNNIQEDYYKLIEEKIHKFGLELEVRLNLKEAELQWNDFKKTILDGIKEDDILGNAKVDYLNLSAYYKEDNTGSIQALVKNLQGTLLEIDKMNKGQESIFSEINAETGEFIADRTGAFDKLRENLDELQTNMTEFKETQDKIYQAYLDAMDEAAEKFDNQIELYETIGNLIEHDMELIQLTRGEESYEELSKYYDKQQQNNNQQLDFLRQQEQFWENAMNNAEKGSDEWLKAKENWTAAVEATNGKIIESIQDAQDKYLNMINLTFQKLNNKVTGGLGLNYVSEEWELINKKSDMYLDTVNAIYNTQQLANKYQTAINDTNSITAQRKLNNLMEEELARLQKKDKLTQYDIDRAELRYQIALKQIALEEAQQNKSTMRLRRDSQGNYRYQFVADDDAVSKAQDEVSNLYNQLYNLDYSKYQDNLNQIYDLWVEYQDKMKESSMIMDEDERNRLQDLYKTYYSELIDGVIKENEEVRQGLQESTYMELLDFYTNDEEAFKNNLGNKFAGLEEILEQSKVSTGQIAEDATTAFGVIIDASVEAFDSMKNQIIGDDDSMMAELISGWDNGIQHMADAIKNEGGFRDTCVEAWGQIDAAANQYNQDIGLIEINSGKVFDKIISGLDDTIPKTEQLLEDNKKLIDTYVDLFDAIKDIIIEMEKMNKEMEESMNLATQVVTKGEEVWKKEQQSNADTYAEDNGVTTGTNNSNNGNNNNNNTGGGTGQGSSSGDSAGGAGKGIPGVISHTDLVKLIRQMGQGVYDNYPGRKSQVNAKYPGAYSTAQSLLNKAWPSIRNLATSKWDSKIESIVTAAGYDTGGYTGSWGSEGKLAMLHQKELVLNAQDTENILNAVEIMRIITANIGSSIADKLSSLSANRQLSYANTTENDVLEQNVHINAEFPNVKDAREIENAIDNLMNRAQQHINTKKR